MNFITKNDVILHKNLKTYCEKILDVSIEL